MPSLTRRSVLATVWAVTAGGLAGCGALSDRSPPAGSLRFVNDHDLPHSIRLAVTDVGAEPGSEPGEVAGDAVAPPMQRNLTVTEQLSPNESTLYEDVFTEPIYYGVQFFLDGSAPEDTGGPVAFNPSESGGENGALLGGRVDRSGELSWVISSADNSGRFDR